MIKAVTTFVLVIKHMEATRSALFKLNSSIQKDGEDIHICAKNSVLHSAGGYKMRLSLSQATQKSTMCTRHKGREFFHTVIKPPSPLDSSTQSFLMWWLPTEIKDCIGLTLSSFSLMDFTSLLSSETSCIKQARSLALADDFTNIKITAQVPWERGQSRESVLSYLLARSPTLLMVSCSPAKATYEKCQLLTIKCANVLCQMWWKRRKGRLHKHFSRGSF